MAEERGGRMSRVEATRDTIGEIRIAMVEPIQKPVLYLIPILSEIAISLATIADKMCEKREIKE